MTLKTSTTTLLCVGVANDIEDLGLRLTSESVPYKPARVPKDNAAFAFSVEPLTALIVALGSSEIITPVVKCLMVYLKERKKRIHIVNEGNRIEVTAENYGEKELARVLSGVRGQVHVVLSITDGDE